MNVKSVAVFVVALLVVLAVVWILIAAYWISGLVRAKKSRRSD